MRVRDVRRGGAVCPLTTSLSLPYRRLPLPPRFASSLRTYCLPLFLLASSLISSSVQSAAALPPLPPTHTHTHTLGFPSLHCAA